MSEATTVDKLIETLAAPVQKMSEQVTHIDREVVAMKRDYKSLEEKLDRVMQIYDKQEALSSLVAKHDTYWRALFWVCGSVTGSGVLGTLATKLAGWW